MARLLPAECLPACPGCGIALWTPGLCPLCKQDYFQNMRRQDWAEESNTVNTWINNDPKPKGQK